VAPDLDGALSFRMANALRGEVGTTVLRRLISGSLDSVLSLVICI
jgi:hypothetical protein